MTLTEKGVTRRSEIQLTAILSLNFGFVFLDRNALSYLMPFVAPDLGLNHTQIGILAGATALSWALSGMIISVFSDQIGRRVPILVLVTAAFSLMSVASGFVAGFTALLLVRLLMGLAEGPVLPLSQALIAVQTGSERRGLLMGLMNNFGSNLLGVMIAPPLLVFIAQRTGWRAGFWLAGVPGLLMAIIMALCLHDDQRSIPHKRHATSKDYLDVLKSRNNLLCCVIASLMLAWTLLGWTFLPLNLIQMNGFTPSRMGALMSVLGASAVVASIVVPGISDRIGRRWTLAIFAAVGALTPLSVGFSKLPPGKLAIIIFVGWFASGTLPIFMATIPAESTSPTKLATAMALVMGVGEILGGAVAPAVGGPIADFYGLHAVLVLQAGCAIAASLVALFLTETAPGCSIRRAATESALR